MIDHFNTTVPWAERMEALRQIIRHAKDQVLVMGMSYSTEANMMNNRLQNVLPTRASKAHEWDMR